MGTKGGLGAAQSPLCEVVAHLLVSTMAGRCHTTSLSQAFGGHSTWLENGARGPVGFSRMKQAGLGEGMPG